MKILLREINVKKSENCFASASEHCASFRTKNHLWQGGLGIYLSLTSNNPHIYWIIFCYKVYGNCYQCVSYFCDVYCLLYMIFKKQCMQYFFDYALFNHTFILIFMAHNCSSIVDVLIVAFTNRSVVGDICWWCFQITSRTWDIVTVQMHIE